MCVSVLHPEGENRMPISDRYAALLAEADAAPASKKAQRLAANRAKAKAEAKQLQTSIEQLSKEIVKEVKAFLDVDDSKIDYGTVGSLQAVRYRLDQTLKFIKGTPDE